MTFDIFEVNIRICWFKNAPMFYNSIEYCA